MHRRVLPLVCLVAAALCYGVSASAASLYPGTTFLAGNTPAAVVMAQLRPGSGLQDIVEIGQTGYINVLLNNGDGTFAAPLANYVSDGQPQALAVADVNGDGIPDIIVANTASVIAGATLNGNDVTVLIGLGNGLFKAPIASDVANGIGVAAPSYAVGNTPLSIAVADVNGDGFPDIVTANSADNDVSVLINNGNGTFKAQQVFPTGIGPDCVAIADVDNDGHPDVLVDNASDNTFAVLFGFGDGTFRAQHALSLGAVQTSRPRLQSFVAGQLRTGGPIDVVVSVLGGLAGSVSVLVNDGRGGFSIGKTYPAGTDALTLLLADVDKDGKLDLIAASPTDGVVNVFFGNGDGTLGTRTTYATVGISNAPGQQAMAVADVNGDTYPDIVVANPANQTMQVLYNSGASGSFPPGTFHPPGSYPVGSNPSAVATGALTASGFPDVVVANAGDNDVGVLLNKADGSGKLKPMSTFLVGVSPQAVVLAATRGGGKPLDIITANFGDGTVSVLLGDGTGNFPTTNTYVAVPPTPGATTLGLQVADINGDGAPDIIVTNGISNTFGVLLGQLDGSGKPTGTFQPLVTFPSSNSLVAIAVADLNGDGIPDVVTVGGTITIFSNSTPQCKPPFAATDACENPSAVAFAAVAAYSIPGTQITVANVSGQTFSAKGFPIDGKPVPSLLIADYARGNLDVLNGNSAVDPTTNLGTATFLTPLAFGSAPGAASVLAAGSGGPIDVNNDGSIDAVVTNALNNSVSIFFGNGAGKFLNNLYPVELNPRSAAVANLGNRFYDPAKTQPILDVVVANHGSNTITTMLQIATAVSSDTAPVANAQSLTVADGKFPVASTLSASDVDAADFLTFGIVNLPGNGTVTLDPATGFYEYQADSQFAGPDSFNFQVSDGVKLSNTATVTVTVQSNSSVTSKSGAGAFGILPFLALLPFVRRRRRRVS